MRIKQFVIMIMIICGCVSAGCKNKEVQESDKTASESSHLARQEVEYPEKEYTYEKIIFIDPVNGRSDDGSGGSEPEYRF